MKLLKLPALIFFLLALSYNVRAQYASPNMICYGEPIHLFCAGLYGCGMTASTYTWSNWNNTWSITGTTAAFQNPVIPQGDPGYYSDLYDPILNPYPGHFLSIQYIEGGVAKLSSGVANVTLLGQIFIDGTVSAPSCDVGNTGAITLTVSGGFVVEDYTYKWSNGPLTKDVTGLSAGTYTVTVKDDNECTNTKTFSVTQPPSMTITKTGGADVTCNLGNDGYINISVSGGSIPLSYHWSNGTSNQNVSTLTQGTYTVTVTDATLCTKTTTYAVSQPAAMSFTQDVPLLKCNGDNNGTISITVSPGGAGYSYAWSNGGGNSASITGLTVGTYTVTVTNGGGCTKTGAWAVSQPTALALAPLVHEISCGGVSDGALTITMSGGTSPYRYNWSNGHTATGLNVDGISSLSVGTYTVSVTDANTCPKIQSWTLTAPADLSLSFGSTAPLCNQSADGTITVSVAGGLTAHSYLWNNGQTNATAIGLATGTYSVTVTDVGPCTETGSWAITAPGDLTITGTPTNIKCNGGSSGDITITVTGGTTAYSYNWNVIAGNGGRSTHVSNLYIGTYTVTVTDNHLCTKIKTWELTEPVKLSGDGAVTAVGCFGGSNGSASFTGIGGTSPYKYLWNTGSTAQLITGLTAGTYSVSVTDFNSCPNKSERLITQPVAPLTASGTPTIITCYLGNNGTITATATGGTPNPSYSFSWNNGQLTPVATGLTAGTYTVTVTDSHSCTDTKTFAVTSNPLIGIGLVDKKDPSCLLSTDGYITVSASGGGGPGTYQYVWSAPGGTTSSLSGLATGTYTVTVTNAGSCGVSASWAISAPADLTISGTPTNIKCNGGSSGDITITVTGGTTAYSYNWNVIAGNGGRSAHVSNLYIGTYTVTVTDNHLCTKIKTWELTEPVKLSGDGAVTAVGCFGGSNGSASFTGIGGTSPYKYLWNTGSTAQLITGLTAGTYSVSVTDFNSCPNKSERLITQPVAPLTASGTPTIVTCYQGNDGTITATATGGTPNPSYSFLWNNGLLTPVITGLTAGTYTVTVTDSHSCTDTKTFAVTSNPLIVIGLVDKKDPSCLLSTDGYITVSASGGGGAGTYRYIWSAPGGTTSSLSGLGTGTYTVTVTNAGSCGVSATWAISAPADLTISGTPTNIKCNGGSTGDITITVTGGTTAYSYNWNVIAGNGGKSAHVSNLYIGTYTVTVTDNHLCTKIKTWELTEPVKLSGDGEVTAVGCFGGSNGSASFTGIGGTSPYKYLWNTGSTAQLITGLTAGTYSVSVTDFNSCPNKSERLITQPLAPLTASGTPTIVTCYQGNDGTITATATGGTPNPSYSFSWNNGLLTPVITGLTAGTYTVTVTDSHSCTDTKTFAVTSNPLIVIGLVDKKDPSCLLSTDGYINVSASGGGGVGTYRYVWSAPGGTTSSLSGLATGTYTVTVTNQGSCGVSASWAISAPADLTISGTPTNIKCNGGSTGDITITVTGGTTAYSYNWNVIAGNGGKSAHVSNLFIGTYTVTVTDNHLCTKIKTWELTEPVKLSGDGEVTAVGCFGGSNGSASFTGIGGTSPYKYLWNTGSTSQLITGLTAGTYSVSVTDFNSCPNKSERLITQPLAPLTASGTPTIITCYQGNDGTITATATGGTPNPSYSFSWNNGLLTPVITGLTAGTYTVTVTDSHSCTDTKTFAVTANPIIVIVLVDKQNPKCFTSSDGSITVSASGGGGAGTYRYVWSAPGGTTSSLTGLATGTYTVTVTNQGSCGVIGTWSITAPSALSVVVPLNMISCYGYSTGVLTASASGGTPNYNYVWNTGATSQTITGLSAGTYLVTVTDANTCKAYGEGIVSQPAAWSVGISDPGPACCNANEYSSYTASVWYIGGVDPNPACPVTYQWVVVGGTIKSGWNGPTITVDWACCGQGTVTVTATKCNCMVTHTLNVTVYPAPAPILNGPATVYANSSTEYCVLPAVAGHLYSWTVEGGTITSPPGTNCITVLWGDYPPCGCGFVKVCETNPLTGCTGCDILHITILPNVPVSHDIYGYVVYDGLLYVPGTPPTTDPLLTPLNGVTIKLYNKVTGTVAATTVSGPNMNSFGEPGYWQFNNIANLTDYQLLGSYNGTWGGNNATDALLIQLQSIFSTTPPYLPLTGLKLTCADVSATGLPITALDALYVKLRTIGMISSYPAGNWKFTDNNIIAYGPTDFRALCVGDVNGSYIPTGLKESSFLSAIDDETLTVPVGTSFNYEVRSNQVENLGAMTLFMGYDAAKFEIEDVSTSLNEMKYVINDGNIALAWSDTKPFEVNTNEPVISLKMKVKEQISDAVTPFVIKPGSEFATSSAVRLDNFEVKLSKLKTINGSHDFSINNYPNPFTNKTDIVYNLPESGRIRLVVTDLLGKTIAVLVDSNQPAGTYTITVNPNDYNMHQGIYLYKIEVNGSTENFVKVNKMIFNK